MSPTLDGDEDGVGGFGPDERLGLVVGLGDEAVDGGLQFDDRGEDATLEPLPGELGKPALDCVGPRARGRREVEADAGMACEPVAHLGVLMGSIVVEDHMDRLVGRHLALDSIEKADEFLVPVALHAASDDLAVQDVEGGEQGGGAMALVVVGHGGAASLLHRQAGLGAIEGLDLALLVEAEHDGVGRRIHMKTDDLL